MVLNKGSLPATPRGHRLLCEPLPVKTETESGLTIPAIAQHRPHAGIIIHAGLNALDALYDHGDKVGDEIWWGKFAGVMEEWDRIVDEGKGWKTCDHRWDRQASPGKDQSAWTCGNCGSKRLASPLCVLNHDDILCNVSLQRRIEAGEIAQKRGKTDGNRTQHFMDRKDG
jgi:co-chaperonin GroES (HSP10)